MKGPGRGVILDYTGESSVITRVPRDQEVPSHRQEVTVGAESRKERTLGCWR